VRRRGELMWNSGVERPGAMAAILGMSRADVEEVCRAAAGAGKVCAANVNAPRQVVISGDTAAVESAMAIARERGAKRAIRLEVSGAFHSPLMAPAAEGLRAALHAVRFEPARFPVTANVDAAAKTAPAEVTDALDRQLTSPVNWVGSMEAMAARGVELFLEIGPGRVLAGLARQIVPEARVMNVENGETLEAALEAIRSLEQAGGRA
jgi:[acyl-carrier-protein] S-malonyltransferase